MAEPARWPARGGWLAQRVTAILMLPLGAWFLVAVTTRAGYSPAAIRAWMAAPQTAALLLLLLLCGLLHLVQGVAVIVEDYLSAGSRRNLVMRVVRVGALGLAGVGAAALLALAAGIS